MINTSIDESAAKSAASKLESDPHAIQPSILSYVKDLPNLCSLAGLACTVLSIYFSIIGIYYAAMIGMIWAVAFDWGDGLIARSIEGRSSDKKTFGMQLDSLIDIVNYGVAPAIFLLSYGNYNLIFLPAAFIMLAASAMRLSYFNTFGLSGSAEYTGLALDSNNIILVFIFLFESFFSQPVFSWVVCLSGVGLSALNVSKIKTPKLSGNSANVYLLAVYTLAITGIYAWKLL